jgi:molybdopterin/thiamine biosynthesis adenylyltransferase
VKKLVSEADLIVDCAPKFEERYLMNAEAVRQRKPMVEAAMFELDATLTTFLPGKTPCLACLYPEKPPNWKRKFPVLGAVSGTAGCLAALEAVKVLTGLGEPLANRLLLMDLRYMEFRTVTIKARADCPVCSSFK